MERVLDAIFVGCGGFAKNYLPVHGELPFVRPVLCVDADESFARAMAEKVGASSLTTDFERAVTTPADFAVVSTPNHLHVPQASALLQSGKHVLLQKPMARNLNEARQLVATQRQSNRTLGLYMSMLDFEMWWQVREAIARDYVLGEVCQVSMRLGHTGGLIWNAQPQTPWRFSREKTGGGVFIMLAVHFIHFSRWLLDLRIERVCTKLKNLHCPRIEGEDICQVQAELSNGGLLELSVAWNSQGEHVAVYGTTGSLVYLDNELLRVHGARAWKTSYFAYETPGQWTTFAKLVPPAFGDASNSFNQQRQFAEAIRDGRAPTVGIEEGLLDMQVVDAVYRSAQTGTWQDVRYD